MRPSVRAALVALSTLIVAAACGDGDPTAPGVDPIDITTETLAEAIEGQAYNQQLEAAGGSGGYSWVLAAGSLPSGLTLSPAGVVSGTPVGAGTASFRVRATDSGGRSATADLELPVVQALAVHTSTLPDAEAGVEYAAQLQAVGGRGTLTWELSGEATDWLTVSATGALSGTPETSGPVMVTIAVSDESGQQATRQLPIMVRGPLAIEAVDLPAGKQGRAYAAQFVASGGDGMYAWAIESGALPAGVFLTTEGALIGTPTSAGEFHFTVEVSDGADRAATRSFSLTVERAPSIQTTSLPPGDVGEPYTAQLAATGGTGAYTWSLIDGALPDGLTLSPAGLITGTPTTLGSATFTVRVTDEAAATDSRALTLVVATIEVLANGVAVADIDGAAASTRYYMIDVPANTNQLVVSTSGGTGDVDLYVRHGQIPQEHAYDCRPLRTGNGEICTFPSPAAGSWYVMLRGYEAYADVTLVATYDE